MLVFFLVTILGLLVCSLFLRNNMQKHSVFLKLLFGDRLVTLTNKETFFPEQ